MRIIVYGSLRRKQGNSHWMTDAQLLGEYDLDGYEMYNLGYYPAVIPGEGRVHCEVYRINSSILSELDELKSNTKAYKRELVQTPFGSAWIYIYQLKTNDFSQIRSGDWLKRHEEG